MRTLLICSLLGAITLQAQADSELLPIKIISFEENKNSFSFVASPEDKDWLDERCEKIKVSGSYDHEKWEKFDEPMNHKSHHEALKILKKAQHKNKTIYFGSYSAGLYEKTDCNYVSKGLLPQQEGIFSLYTNP